MFGLRDPCLDRISPVNEKILEIVNANAVRALSPSTAHLAAGNGAFHGSASGNSLTSLGNSEVTRRTSKRKVVGENSLNAKRRGDVPKLDRICPKSFPPEYPFNKEGYRSVRSMNSRRTKRREGSFLDIIWLNQIHIHRFDRNLMKRKFGQANRFLDISIEPSLKTNVSFP